MKFAGVPFANAEAAGYFRSDYAPEMLHTLIAESARLSAPERIVLIGDRVALMRAGRSDVGDTMNLLAALKDEPNAQVLAQMGGGFGLVEDRIAVGAQAKQLDAWALRTLGPVYAALGPLKQDEPEETVLRRVQLMRLLGASGDPAVIKEAMGNYRSGVERGYIGQSASRENVRRDRSAARRSGFIQQAAGCRGTGDRPGQADTGALCADSVHGSGPGEADARLRGERKGS